jgi:DNA-binding transcriptional regulator YdaS (Cro superfamily)
MENYVQKAIELCGSQTELARRCGVKQQHVWKWLHELRAVPAERAIAIEIATGGAVTCEQLRPDIRWDLIRKNCPCADSSQEGSQ